MNSKNLIDWHHALGKSSKHTKPCKRPNFLGGFLTEFMLPVVI